MVTANKDSGDILSEIYTLLISKFIAVSPE